MFCLKICVFVATNRARQVLSSLQNCVFFSCSWELSLGLLKNIYFLYNVRLTFVVTQS